MANIHSNISFGLVNIPVVMNPIIKNNDTSFNQLHKKCLHRISYVKYCTHCNKSLKESEITKGYEYENNSYVVFSKEELNKLKVVNNKEIEIVAFISEKDIDSVFYEKSYFLDADNKSKAYNLFREALKKTKLVALAKTVISTKFYYVILRFIDNGIIMTTLYFAEEVKIPDKQIKSMASDKELDLAIQLIKNLKGKFEPLKYKDEYQNQLKNAINNKLEGKAIKKTKLKSKKQVSDLMKALEESLKDNK